MLSVTECLERIEQLNPRLNAFITVVRDGPRRGMPVGIKDFYDTAGIRTTAAFKAFANRVPSQDAGAVTQLKQAGAVIVGKTNMHELGQGTTSLVSHFGPVKNPWNADFIAGGSSGGSAAAVASEMCFATLDTDAIGSCRLPAACCGVVGFKPSYGLIGTEGILAGEPADPAILALGHAAITARTAADVARVLAAFATLRAPKSQPHIGIVTNFKAAKPVRAVFAAAIAPFADATPTTAPLDTPGFDIRDITADRRAIARTAFRDVDVLVLPTTTDTTPTVQQATGNPLALSAENTLWANYYGLPAISVPMGMDSRGLPLGLQLVGRPGDDATVLELARQFEELRGVPAPRPPLLGTRQ
jgi:aspartyl-tRNA(Asn)/glutamyl-tRNA(Gln) amidotransferase subunit A